MSVLSRARFGLATLAGAPLALVLTAVSPALIASAHVTISSSDATPGGSGTLAFRVPTESDTAGTVSLSVDLPADTPFRSVRAGYLPGWTVTVERTALPEPVEIDGFTLTEAVSRVTWTADAATTAAGGIGADQFGQFQLRVGPFPEEGGTFVFPATQTYSDGEVVAWADPVVDGAAEPEHPAPTITVGDVAGEGDHDDDHSAATEESEGAGESDGSDTAARVLGIVGIGLGAAGLVGGTLAGRRRKDQDVVA